MRKKTISKIIKAKVDDWVSSIEDEGLRSDLIDDIIVTGGAIASLLMKEPVKDYDVYLTKKSTVKRLADYYCDRFNKSNPGHSNRLNGQAAAFVLDGEDVEAWKKGSKELDSFAPGFSNQGDTISYMITNTAADRIKIIVRSDGVATEDRNRELLNEPFEDAVTALAEADSTPVSSEEIIDYHPVFLSPNAVTLSGDVQFVLRFYGQPEQIHENYDFVHCTNYWTSKGGLVLKQEALEAILAKELVYTGSKYPVCSIIRTRKFVKRGFHINAGQYLKMCFQVSELDLTDIAVLEDQLVGVDSAYFINLIKALQEKASKESEFVLNSGYLCSIIDKIF